MLPALVHGEDDRQGDGPPGHPVPANGQHEVDPHDVVREGQAPGHHQPRHHRVAADVVRLHHRRIHQGEEAGADGRCDHHGEEDEEEARRSPALRQRHAEPVEGEAGEDQAPGARLDEGPGDEAPDLAMPDVSGAQRHPQEQRAAVAAGEGREQRHHHRDRDEQAHRPGDAATEREVLLPLLWLGHVSYRTRCRGRPGRNTSAVPIADPHDTPLLPPTTVGRGVPAESLPNRRQRPPISMRSCRSAGGSCGNRSATAHAHRSRGRRPIRGCRPGSACGWIPGPRTAGTRAPT